LKAKHGLGYIPDLGDHRDHTFKVAADLALPPLVDLRDQDSPIEDQGQLGSCTSFATGAAIRFARRKEGLPDFVTSHLFLYYNSRSIFSKSADSGATIRDAIKAAGKTGDCPESEWPYNISQFAVKPPAQCYTDALQDRALKYQRIGQSLVQMKNCLAQGLPFVIGISVYESFEGQQAEQTGMIPLPKNNEQLLGGHALLVLGYRDSDLHFIVRNSWGANFGDSGYVYLPYAYLQDTNLASDFWCIQAVGK
jgi:C1A family cysteine protease